MDGRSCGLEGALTPGGGGSRSPTSAARPGSSAPRRCALVDGTCEAARSGACPLEAHVCTCFSQSMSLQATKGLQKCATFPPSSGEAQQPDGSSDGVKAAPGYERSISLPITSKLISALKGSREKNGMASPTRHVKWAPDVYDPPVTSVCHSVNSSSYKRRAKVRKKEKNKEKNKQKRKHKGKSKKTNQNCIQNSSLAPDLGSKAVSTTGGQSCADDTNKDEAVLMDYNMGNQEAKCGSSFLRESVAKMHFSIAEAS